MNVGCCEWVCDELVCLEHGCEWVCCEDGLL